MTALVLLASVLSMAALTALSRRGGSLGQFAAVMFISSTFLWLVN